MKAVKKVNTAVRIIALVSLLVGVTPELEAQWAKSINSQTALNDPVSLKLRLPEAQGAHEGTDLLTPYTIKGFRYRAFFCAVEERITKESGIPFRFRLGSVPYVDMLESKGKERLSN